MSTSLIKNLRVEERNPNALLFEYWYFRTQYFHSIAVFPTGVYTTRILSPESDITKLLVQIKNGDEAAQHKLLSIVYENLRRIARNRIGVKAKDVTLNPTSLVHEAYIKLANLDKIDWQNRAHFYALAAQAMRQVIYNDYVKKNAQKRGGDAVKVQVDIDALAQDVSSDVFNQLEDALKELEQLEPRQARIIEHRFFGGLTIEETAEVLNVSTATVKRDWTVARLWLARALNES